MSLFSNVAMMSAALRNFEAVNQTHANNIANANTLGYSRRRVDLRENLPGIESNFILGNGANISSIARLRDVFLDIQIRTNLSRLGYESQFNQSLKSLQAIFPDVLDPISSAGIAGRLKAHFDAWMNLANSPSPSTNNAGKRAVIDAGLSLAGQLRATAQSLAQLRRNLDVQVQAKMDAINGLLEQVAGFNREIKSNNVQRHDLLDAREVALQKLARLADFRFQEVVDGTVTIYMNRGSLVEGSNVFRLTATKGLPDPDLLKIGYPKGSPSPMDVTADIRGGELGALLELRDRMVEPIFLDLRAIGTGLIEVTNLIYRSGGGGDFFTGRNASDILVKNSLATDSTGASLRTEYYFTNAAPVPGALAKALGHARNFLTGTFLQTAGITGIANGNTVAGLAPGTLTLNLADGSSINVAYSGTDTLNQIAERMTQSLSGAGAVGYDDATNKFTVFFNQPATYFTDGSGSFAGTAKLAAFLLSATNVNASSDVQVQPVAGGDVFSSPNGLLRYFMRTTPTGLVSIEGVNVAWNEGESINVVGGNIAGATGLSAFFNTALFPQRLVLRRYDPNPLASSPLNTFTESDITGNFSRIASVLPPSSVTNRYAGIQSGISSQVSVSDLNLQAAQSLVNKLQLLQDTVAKVDLNQELAQAMAFQRAYEASVRILTIIDQMLNVLINRTASPSSQVETGVL